MILKFKASSITIENGWNSVEVSADLDRNSVSSIEDIVDCIFQNFNFNEREALIAKIVNHIHPSEIISLFEYPDEKTIDSINNWFDSKDAHYKIMNLREYNLEKLL